MILPKLAEPLGNAVRELVAIVTFRTFQRCRADAKETARKPEEGRQLVVTMAEEIGWGYTRILGEFKKLRITNICRNTVKNVLKENGFDLGPKRGHGTWDELVKIHLKTLWACDMISKEVRTLHGKATYFILFFIEVGTRRVRMLGRTAHPSGEWVAQMARNIRMWWEEHRIRPSYIIKDRDTRFAAQFDGIREKIGATVKRLRRKSPNLNAYARAWVGTFRRECSGKFIVLGEGYLDHICRGYEGYWNSVRVHSSLDNEPIGACEPPRDPVSESEDGIICESWLGGVLRHCRRAAA